MEKENIFTCTECAGTEYVFGAYEGAFTTWGVDENNRLTKRTDIVDWSDEWDDIWLMCKGCKQRYECEIKFNGRQWEITNVDLENPI